MKKISLSQIYDSQSQTVQLFRCSIDSSHLVEDALMCQICDSILCKDCFHTRNKCLKCNNSINPDQDQLPDHLKKLLNPISIKCENSDRGCKIKIDYENYRRHTKNCQYKKKNENKQKSQKSCSFLRKIFGFFCEKRKSSNSNNAQEIPINEKSTQNLSEEIFRKPNNVAKPEFSNEIPKFNSINQNYSPNPYVPPNKFGGSCYETPIPNYSNPRETYQKYPSLISNSPPNNFTPYQTPMMAGAMNQNGIYRENVSPSPNYYQNVVHNNFALFQTPLMGYPNQNENYENYRGFNNNKQEATQNKSPLPNYYQNVVNERNLKADFQSNKKPIKYVIIKNEDLVRYTNSDYENLTNQQLKAILARRGISKTGNKSELIEKVKLYVENYKNKGKNKALMDRLSVKCKPSLESSSDSDSSSEYDLSSEMDYFLVYYYFPGLNISDSQLKKFSSKQLERFTNDDLKTFLEFRNISKIGNKEELIFKIKKYFKDKEERKNGNFSKIIQNKKDKLMEKSLDELKYLMIKNDLPISGTKSDLADRILRKKKLL